MRKAIPILITAMLVFGLVFNFVWQRPRSDINPPPTTVRSDLELEGSPEPELSFEMDPGFDGDTQIDPPLAERRGRVLSENEVARLRKIVDAQEPFPHDAVMNEYKAELWAQIQANPPALRPLGDPDVDAEMAYQLYMYYGNCSVMPRTGEQIDSRLQQMAARVERTSERGLDSLERRADRMIDAYEFCSTIPLDVDPRMEAVNWMSKAVQLGHEIAQVQYYDKAMGFLLRPDRLTNTPPLVMQHPELISEFKATARLGLTLAMENGHPEAYLAMSEAVQEGVIFPQDPVLALAYARVAENLAMKNRILLQNLERMKTSFAQLLTPDQVAEAEELALQLRLEIGG